MAGVHGPVLHPLVMPTLSRADAKRASRLARASSPVAFRIGTTAIVAQPPCPASAPGQEWAIHCTLGLHRLVLCCSHAVLSQLLRILGPGLNLDPAPLPSIMALLVDTLVQPILSSLEQVLGSRLSIKGVEAGSGPVEDAFAVQLDVAGQPSRIFMVGEESVDVLLDRWPARPHGLTELRLPSQVCLGTTELPLNVVASLRDGDAVLLQDRPPGGLRLTVSERWGGPARREGDGVVLLAHPSVLVQQAGNTEMPPTDGTSLDTLPVRLDFNVGHQELSLAELRTLQAGSVLPVGRERMDLVEVTVNGRRIGTGELVDIDGMVAVRLSRVFGLD